MVFEVGTNFTRIPQHGLHVIFVGVLIVVAAVVGVDGTSLVFGIAVPTARYEVMRKTQDSLVGIEKIELAGAIAVYGYAERRRLELHQSDGSCWRSGNCK